MKERPILFSAPMVRAILDGTKTQTRRVIRNPDRFSNIRECGRCCPYGTKGEHLWVRETWADTMGEPPSAVYRADGERHPSSHMKWRPAIHMPRWASRITLRIIDARVECLGEISNADAEAEGVKCDYSSLSFRDHFGELWDRINGKRAPWRSNPWVWVVQFERV